MNTKTYPWAAINIRTSQDGTKWENLSLVLAMTGEDGVRYPVSLATGRKLDRGDASTLAFRLPSVKTTEANPAIVADSVVALRSEDGSKIETFPLDRIEQAARAWMRDNNAPLWEPEKKAGTMALAFAKTIPATSKEAASEDLSADCPL